MEPFIPVERLCAITPGTTKGYWAQLRFTGKGPRFYKPSPKVVLYRESEVMDWLNASARYGTAAQAV